MSVHRFWYEHQASKLEQPRVNFASRKKLMLSVWTQPNGVVAKKKKKCFGHLVIRIAISPHWPFVFKFILQVLTARPLVRQFNSFTKILSYCVLLITLNDKIYWLVSLFFTPYCCTHCTWILDLLAHKQMSQVMLHRSVSKNMRILTKWPGVWIAIPQSKKQMPEVKF